MKNVKYFSTGNHPVETLLPMLYWLSRLWNRLATLSGNLAKLENVGNAKRRYASNGYI
jgi:molecular chaperone Hsp31 and glyoxalase 3